MCRLVELDHQLWSWGLWARPRSLAPSIRGKIVDLELGEAACAERSGVRCRQFAAVLGCCFDFLAMVSFCIRASRFGAVVTRCSRVANGHFTLAALSLGSEDGFSRSFGGFPSRRLANFAELPLGRCQNEKTKQTGAASQSQTAKAS